MHLKAILIVSVILPCIGCEPTTPVFTPTFLQDKLTDGSLAPKMAVVPAGEGTVGGENFRSFQNQAPAHKVIIERPYAMGVTEITFAEYDVYCNATQCRSPDDNGWGRGDQPVINVTWLEAVDYTKWLSKETGETYRLPSEAEWEYAARAGSNTKFWWGDDYQQGMDHCDRDLGGCPQGSAIARPGPVGRFKANPFGLYDVTSNVNEWVLDCYKDGHEGAGTKPIAYVQPSCDEVVVKGASWANPQPFVHLYKRYASNKTDAHRNKGFRVLREIK